MNRLGKEGGRSVARLGIVHRMAVASCKFKHMCRPLPVLGVWASVFIPTQGFRTLTIILDDVGSLDEPSIYHVAGDSDPMVSIFSNVKQRNHYLSMSDTSEDDLAELRTQARLQRPHPTHLVSNGRRKHDKQASGVRNVWRTIIQAPEVYEAS